MKQSNGQRAKLRDLKYYRIECTPVAKPGENIILTNNNNNNNNSAHKILELRVHDTIIKLFVRIYLNTS